MRCEFVALVACALCASCVLQRDGLAQEDVGTAGPVDAGPSAPDDAAGPVCAPSAEQCNGLDDDCDGEIDEAPIAATGSACDGPDDDACSEGLAVCASGSIACSDATDDSLEACNTRDDDCNGQVDETGCPCARIEVSGRVLLVCATTRRTWSAARAKCRELGYDLVVLRSAAESQALLAALGAMSNDAEWWIGLNQPTGDGDWVWVDGPVNTIAGQWRQNEPNNGGVLGDEDCAAANSRSRAGWNDEGCDLELAYVCGF